MRLSRFSFRPARILALMLVVAMPVPALADSADAARSMIDDVGKKTLEVINNGGGKAQKQAALEKLLSSSVDIPWVGRFVMGRYWREATPEQRTRYLREYNSFLLSNYAGRFAEYTGASYKITGARAEEGGKYAVNMELMTPDKQIVMVNYRLHKSKDGKLQIFDVIVEGVSLITTQRSEFASILGNQGIDYLIGKLSDKSLVVSDPTKKS